MGLKELIAKWRADNQARKEWLREQPSWLHPYGEPPWRVREFDPSEWEIPPGPNTITIEEYVEEVERRKRRGEFVDEFELKRLRERLAAKAAAEPDSSEGC